MSSNLGQRQKPSGARRLLSRSAIFALGDLLTKGAKYITLPIFVAVMTVQEVGVLGIFQAVSMICWAIATLGFGAAVRRFYRDGNGQTDELLIGRLWLIRLLLASIPISIVGLVAWFFGNKYFPSMPLTWVFMAICTGYLRAGTDVVESWYIIREEPVTYRTFTFLRFLTTTSLVLLLVVGLKYGVFGAIIGELVGAAAWCLIAGYLALVPHRSPKADASQTSQSDLAKNESPSKSLRQIFRYSLPIIPHASFLWMLVTLDRLILQQYVDNASIGVYEVAYLYASLLIVVATAINSAWLPDFFRTANDENGPKRFARTADLFFACVIGCGIGLSLVSPDAIALLTGGREAYVDVGRLSRIILIGTVFQCFFMAFAQPLFYTGRTMTLAMVSGLGVAVNVIANLVLIPKLGTMGSAWATAAAYGAMVIAMIVIVHNTYRVPWNFLGIIGAGIGFLTLTLLAPLGTEPAWSRFTLRLICAAMSLGLVFGWFKFSRKPQQDVAFYVAADAQGESQ